jgi:GTP cyclohydrolase IA
MRQDKVITPPIPLVDVKKATEAVEQLLDAVGVNWRREGMMQTPARHVKYLMEFLHHKDPFKMTTFPVETDSMVVVRDIEFFSLCEHHLLPFFGKATIAYIPGDGMVGLSKLPRLLDYVVRNPQNQERICKEVIQHLEEALRPKGCAITINAHHTCMSMRGAKCNHTASTITTQLSGIFKDSGTVRQEYNTYLKL